MKTDVSPMFLTYFMLDWAKIKQSPSDQRCTLCGKAMAKTEEVEDSKGVRYEGYVCHPDKQVLWVRSK
jgi:hypothetical protein